MTDDAEKEWRREQAKKALGDKEMEKKFLTFFRKNSPEDNEIAFDFLASCYAEYMGEGMDGYILFLSYKDLVLSRGTEADAVAFHQRFIRYTDRGVRDDIVRELNQARQEGREPNLPQAPKRPLLAALKEERQQQAAARSASRKAFFRKIFG